jgi:hypothetical protein
MTRTASEDLFDPLIPLATFPLQLPFPSPPSTDEEAPVSAQASNQVAGPSRDFRYVL